MCGSFAPGWPAILLCIRPRQWWHLAKRDQRILKPECGETQSLSSHESEEGVPQSQEPEYSRAEIRRPESKRMPARKVIRVEVLSQDRVKEWGLCSFSFLPPILHFTPTVPSSFLYGYSKLAPLLRSGSHPLCLTKHFLLTQSHSYSFFCWLMLLTICAAHSGLNLTGVFWHFWTCFSVFCFSKVDDELLEISTWSIVRAGILFSEVRLAHPRIEPWPWSLLDFPGRKGKHGQDCFCPRA